MEKAPLKGRRRVTFVTESNPGREVYVAGTFNNWKVEEKQLKDPKSNGHYRTTLMLPRGKHEYKFVIDGDWHADPECPHWAPNDYGSLNSVIHVT